MTSSTRRSVGRESTLNFRSTVSTSIALNLALASATTARTLPDVDELMRSRTSAMTLAAIENKLWNWDRKNKRMEFVGAKLKPNLSNQDFAAVKDMFCE